MPHLLQLPPYNLKGHIEEESSDAEIVCLLKGFTEEITTLTITGLDSIVEYSLLSSANTLAYNLLKQQPMLLPQLYKNYCNTFSEVASSHNYGLAVTPESVVSTRYLLSYLVTRLGKHLLYTMKQRSAGILLYRRGSDLLLVLTKVLHRECSHTYHQAPNTLIDTTDTCQVPNTCTATSSRVWEEMNAKIHNQIHKNLGSLNGQPFDISTFDLDHWVELMDKDILKMLAVLTKPKREKNTPCDDVYEGMLKSHTKKLRCFNLACIIMFCANSECNFPLHTLLADAIECFGGSTELIKIFNRLGVVFFSRQL